LLRKIAIAQNYILKLVPKAIPQSWGFSKLLFEAAAQSCSWKCFLKLFRKAVPQNYFPKLLSKVAPNNYSPLKIMPKIACQNYFLKLFRKMVILQNNYYPILIVPQNFYRQLEASKGNSSQGIGTDLGRINSPIVRKYPMVH
jgi:hypothetical protein